MIFTTDRQQALTMLRDDLLTVKEYAFLTRQCEEIVRRRCRKGTQRGAMRIDGQWRIRYSQSIGSI